MKKLLILFTILALMGSISVSALNISQTDTIALGETKVVTVPSPEGEIDESTVYFQQEFVFTPKESGTYRVLMNYADDEATPYDLTLDVPGAYRKLENGIEFEAMAGEACQICFQYPTHDGRYPEISFFLGTPDMEPIPQTQDRLVLLPMLCIVLCAAVLVVTNKQYCV